jgi:TonB family protein
MVMKFAARLASASIPILAALFVPGAAAAQTWSEAPSVADVAASYPAKAKAAGAGGMVDLSCTINHEGRPKDCAALGEKPTGMGFGFTARKLAERMKLSDASLNGKEIRIPVMFDPAVLKGSAPTVSQPAWSALPTAQDFQASFPQTANGVNTVRVALVCDVVAGGALASCSVDREEPAGQGYGAGALALAPKFRVGPWSLQGEPTVGAKVRVPIRFELTQVAAPKG